MPTDKRHFPIVEASKAWRKELRTFVALANDTVASGYAHFEDSSEVWGYYPDDEPLKGLHPGDSRAALTPFMAHEVCCILLLIFTFVHLFICIFDLFTQPTQLLHECPFSFFSGHMQVSNCLDLSVVKQMPPCAITAFVLILKIRPNCLCYKVIGERYSRQQN